MTDTASLFPVAQDSSLEAQAITSVPAQDEAEEIVPLAAPANRVGVAFNDRQIQAIESEARVTKVIAGPGSGKTAVSIHRAIRLASLGHRVLMTTFTVAARMEIQSRLDAILGDDPLADNILVMTCGSMAWRISQARPSGALRVLSHSDALGYMDQLLTSCGFMGKLIERELSGDGIPSEVETTEEDSNPRNHARTVAANEAHGAGEEMKAEAREKAARAVARKYLTGVELFTANAIDPHDSNLPDDYADIFPRWLAKMESKGVMTQAGVTRDACEILRRNIVPEILRGITHIIWDEAQDISAAQLLMTRLLSGLVPDAPTPARLTYVGDPHQAIYSWRGAIFGFMSTRHPDSQAEGTRIIPLILNYRSTKTIVSRSRALANSRTGEKTEIVSAGSVLGEPALIRPRRNIQGEAKFVVDRIQALMTAGQVPLHEIAVLGRSHRVLNAVFTALSRAKIPLCYIGGGFFHRPEYRIIKNLCGFLSGEAAHNALPELIADLTGKPCPSMTAEDMLGLTRRTHIRACMQRLKGAAAKRAEDTLCAVVSIFEHAEAEIEASPRDAGKILSSSLSVAIKRLGVGGLVSKKPGGRFYGHTIADLVEMAGGYSSLREYYIGLLEREATQQGQRPTRDHVFIGTPFASKGLEFHSVVVVGLNEGIFPSRRAIMADLREAVDYDYDPERSGGVDEEARLLFVAMTRAKSYLALTYSKTGMGFGGEQRELEPSHLLHFTGIKMPY